MALLSKSVHIASSKAPPACYAAITMHFTTLLATSGPFLKYNQQQPACGCGRDRVGDGKPRWKHAMAVATPEFVVLLAESTAYGWLARKDLEVVVRTLPGPQVSCTAGIVCGGSLAKGGAAKATVLEQFVPWLAEGGEAVTTADGGGAGKGARPEAKLRRARSW